MYTQWGYDWDVEGAGSMLDGLHIGDDPRAMHMDHRAAMAEMQPSQSLQRTAVRDFPGAHHFDGIRFATYRTACKLRFIQRKTNLHAVDIWNVIEAFRENGLNTLEPRMEVNVSRLETLLSSIFYQLNKRLPLGQQINIDASTSLLLNWLLAVFDAEDSGKICVFSIKVALALLCSGKLMDKLRYIFSQISDSNGHLIPAKFAEFLQESLALPAAVYESPSFGYTDSLPGTVFDFNSKVNVNDFLDAIMSEPAPECLLWLPLLHRLASVENEDSNFVSNDENDSDLVDDEFVHPVQCEGCQRDNFSGFRYKCQRCPNYQLCQDCFWQGHTSGNHSNDHEMKEYATFKSPSKQLGHSIRKSFRCVPEKPKGEIPRFPEEPERPLNLQHIVPPSPMPSHNGFHDPLGYDVVSLDSRSTSKSSPSKMNSTLDSRVDDEHRLIARYAARLAADANHAARSPSELSLNLDTSRAQRELIAQLESKNREIMREIVRLRRQQEMEDQALASQQNPTLLAELRSLRQRKEELERHLSTLQESRRDLMVQLEGLMKLLKNHQASPRSTPNSSPRSGSTRSPPLSSSMHSSRSAPTTPGGSGPPPPAPTSADSMAAAGDVRIAFGQSPSCRSLRSDLLVAADSVTNAMSSLVKELNSDSEDDGTGGVRSQSKKSTHGVAGDQDLVGDDLFQLEDDGEAYLRSDDGYMRTQDEDRELYDNDPHALYRHPLTIEDDDRYARTDDDESYIKTDDDEAGNTDWEETMKRWVNR